MNARIALVTTDLDAVGERDHDLAAIVAALSDRSIEAVPVRWRDPSVAWESFDLSVIRSPWDYPEHLADFLGWLGAVEGRTTILNCPATIRWNLDKVYLTRLEQAGVAIVPTGFCDDLAAVSEAIGRLETARVVVKPNVSIGSRDSGLYSRDDPAALELATHILGDGRRVMVQPAIETVAEHGEHGLMCFDGVYSHAFTKGPILRHGGGFLGGRYTEVISPTDADAAEIALAEQASRVIAGLVDHGGCGCADPTPLYARFDIVAGPVGPLLLEAELFEPAYFLHTAPGAEQRFADAVQRRLG